MRQQRFLFFFFILRPSPFTFQFLSHVLICICDNTSWCILCDQFQGWPHNTCIGGKFSDYMIWKRLSFIISRVYEIYSGKWTIKDWTKSFEKPNSQTIFKTKTIVTIISRPTIPLLNNYGTPMVQLCYTSLTEKDVLSHPLRMCH